MNKKQATLDAINFAKKIQSEIGEIVGPPAAGPTLCKDSVIPKSLVFKTRSYIEKTVVQINITYDSGCYDACAVMIRRLIETLIIEAFEHEQIAEKLKDEHGEFFHLSKLIDITLQERKWNLSRNAKRGLEKLKNIGDFSAHGRKFNAHKADIDKNSEDLRIITQEFLYNAGLK